jgi:hypothetical protein
MGRIGNSRIGLIMGFMLIQSAFSQTAMKKNAVNAGYLISVPREPAAFQANWRTGRGVAAEYQAFLSRHLSLFSGLEYLAYPLNSRELANEYNPSQSGWSEFTFDQGVFRTGVFQAGFRLFLSDALYPITVFTQAAGSLTMMVQEKITIRQIHAGQTFIQTTAVGKSETSPGCQAGFGMRVRIFESVRFMMAAEVHGVFSSDQSDNPDAKIRQLSRAQGKPTVFIVFRSAVEYCFR